MSQIKKHELVAALKLSFSLRQATNYHSIPFPKAHIQSSDPATSISILFLEYIPYFPIPTTMPSIKSLLSL